MDLSFKSIPFVGNIRQKFETVIQEIDALGQESTKYVENHVHNVGEGMKKFCSNVQDLVGSVRREAQSTSLKGNPTVGPTIKLINGIEEDQLDTSVKQSPVQPCDLDPVKDQLDSSCKVELSTDASVQPVEREPDLAEEKNDDGSTNEDSDVIVEESSTFDVLDSATCTESKYLEALISGETTDCSCENSCGRGAGLSFATSVPDQEAETPQNLAPERTNAADDLEHVPVISSSSASSEAASLLTSETNMGEKTVTSCSSHTLLESQSRSESCLNNFHEEMRSKNEPGIESSLHPDNSNVVLSTSSASIVSVISENQVVGTSLIPSNSALSPESIGWSNNWSYMSDCVSDGEMETIDLSDGVKLDESCVVVDDNMLFEVSRRTRRMRSYKKKLQDAFSAKKRLTKEYEQLAIWYGDVDIDSGEHKSQSVLITCNTRVSDSDSQMVNSHDSEWELL